MEPEAIGASKVEPNDAEGQSVKLSFAGDAADASTTTISATSAAAILMTWSTSSSNVMYPWTFGVLGWLLGPVLMCMTFFISYIVTMWVAQAALRTKAKTLGELGFLLWGMPGRCMLEGSQLLFQQLFLPVAIVLSMDSLKSVLGRDYPWWTCNIHCTLVFFVFGVALIQVSQQLGHLVSFAYVSIVLLVVQTVCILAYVAITDDPYDVSASSFVQISSSSHEPAFGMGDHERNTWNNLFGAIGIFIYSCLPGCVVVETMAVMQEPDKIKPALQASFVFYMVIYLLNGLPVVFMWGGDTTNPVTLAITGTGALSVLANVILIYSTLLDYVIAATTVNRYAVAIIDKDFTYKWSLSNSAKWALYTSPVSGLALLMALFVPRLESLTGLLNSVAGTTLQVTGPALCFYLSKDTKPVSHKVLLAVIIYGAVLTVLIFVDAVYSIVRLTNYSGDFWCEVVG